MADKKEAEHEVHAPKVKAPEEPTNPHQPDQRLVGQDPAPIATDEGYVNPDGTPYKGGFGEELKAL